MEQMINNRLTWYLESKGQITNRKYKQYFEKKEKSIRPFRFRMKPSFKESKISQTNMHESILHQIPPWVIEKPKVTLELNELPKTKTHPSTSQEKFHNIFEHRHKYIFVFMNGSKGNDKTAIPAV